MDRLTKILQSLSDPPPSCSNYEQCGLFRAQLALFLLDLSKTTGDDFSELAYRLVDLRSSLSYSLQMSSSLTQDEPTGDESSSLPGERATVQPRPNLIQDIKIQDVKAVDKANANDSFDNETVTTILSGGETDSVHTFDDEDDEDFLNIQDGETGSVHTFEDENDEEFLNIQDDRQVVQESETPEQATRVVLTVQSGCIYEVTRSEVLKCLSYFGHVSSLEWGPERHGQPVKFSTSEAAALVLNKVFAIGNVIFHASWSWKDFYMMKHPIPYQILIRSTNLPTSWEKNIIIKKHLAKFGDVTAVNFIGYDRVLVSFRLKSVAQALIGQKIIIGGIEVVLEEVSSKTIY